MQAADEESAREALGDILAQHASPLIRRIAGRQLGSMTETPGADPDLDDIQATVLLRLTAQCWLLRRDRATPAIASLSSYAATATYNACHEWLRARAPRRTRLQNRVRYILTRDTSLTLWEVADREWWCGLRRVQTPPAIQTPPGSQPPDVVLRIAQEQMSLLTRGPRDADPHKFLLQLVRSTLGALRGPCRFRDLVAALAEVLGETDAAAGAADTRPADASDLVDQLEDRNASPAEALEHRDYLERLWSEIVLLPVRQRAALLLNLRDEHGGGMLALLPITGVASKPDIARALEVSEEALAELWSTLPRDDQWIADYLGITRRQVINLRKCARERLVRRMRAQETLPPAREPVASRPV